jgi:hypothetical protein
MNSLHFLGNLPKTEWPDILQTVLNLLLAGLTLSLAWVTFKLAKQTLSYTKTRDLELDTRNGWIEIHKAMVNLRVQRAFVMLPSPLGGNTNEVITNYTLATSQLRGQLDRLNDDPLLIQVSDFLNDNFLTKDWQTERFEKQFDAFVHQVALKSRPK